MFSIELAFLFIFMFNKSSSDKQQNNKLCSISNITNDFEFNLAIIYIINTHIYLSQLELYGMTLTKKKTNFEMTKIGNIIRYFSKYRF